MAEPPLTPERFADLADTFGGNLDRWPAAIRPAARRLLARTPELGAPLAEAARLDDALAGWRVAGPGAALAQSVILAAPGRSAGLRLRRWWTGLGLASAALAGSLCGAAAVAIAPPLPAARAAQPAEATALFDDPQGDDPQGDAP